MQMPLDKAWLFERGQEPVLADKVAPDSMDPEMIQNGEKQPGI